MCFESNGGGGWFSGRERTRKTSKYPRRSKEQQGRGAKASRCRRESCFPAFWGFYSLHLPASVPAGADRALLLFRCYEGDMCLHAEGPLHSGELCAFAAFHLSVFFFFMPPRIPPRSALSPRFLITVRELFVRCLLSPSRARLRRCCPSFIRLASLELRVCSPCLFLFVTAASRRESVRRKEGLKTFSAPLPFICTCRAVFVPREGEY